MTSEKNNRVLGRRGARIIDDRETGAVSGGIQTETFCSFDPQAGPDGDQFTGDCIAH